MHTFDKTDHKTLFRVCCPGEREVLLVLRAQRNATTQTLPMRPCGGGWWQQAVDLAPGEYRARYYAGDDDARTVYLGPAPAIERPVGQSFQTSGLDAVIAVGPDRARRWASHPADCVEERRMRNAAQPCDQADSLRPLVPEVGGDGSIAPFATHLAS